VEVRVFFRIRCLAFAAALGLAAPAVFAQDWSVGATYGLVNDVKRTFRLDNFHPRDVSAWVDYTLEPTVLLRASYVGFQTTGDNADRLLTVVEGQPPVQMPHFKVAIDAVTVAVSYSLFEGFYTSGIFAGVGGYRIRPTAPALEFAAFQDRHETAVGFHAGVDGNFRIHKNVSLIARLTFHGILSQSKRSLLSASAGVAIHP
jgi:hypothetical protein